ncbi:MAG: hypothetical protein PHY93_01740 [Bacteriovorax sp.]|nr:hypothetical protein [Bacteriovorax sp.]
MNKSKDEDVTSTRIVNLDFLRGLFIIFALDEHFTYYINMWYVEYFRDAIALTSTYKIHFPMIGQQIATDHFNYMLGVVFIPWVSQVYLTLASFNLAKKSQYIFKEELGPKLKIFGLIYLFFLMENFIVAPNLGQAISFYPIMLWMIIMSLLSIVYSFVGVRGVLVLTIISLFRWILPVDLISNLFQSFIIYNIHSGFEYDARIEYFFTSGCLGFLMGYVHYHKPNLRHLKDIYFILMGIVLVAFYLAYGEPLVQDPANAFAHEHDLARNFSGTLYILGIQAIVISSFLWLEKKSIRFKIPIVNWVGFNSILIFAFHRIFFVRILAPLSVLFGSLYGRTLGASTLEMYIYVGITIAVCYFIKTSRVGDIILQRKG